MAMAAKRPHTGPISRADWRKETRQPMVAGLLAVVFSGMVAGLIVLAAMAEVPQVIRAPGTIMPYGDYTSIETMEGGIVDVVHHQEGAYVAEGERLIELSNPTLDREHASLVQQRAALIDRASNARAIQSALRSDRGPDADLLADLTASGLQTAVARLALYADRQKIRRKTIEQQARKAEMLSEAVDMAQRRLENQNGRLARQQKLFARNLQVVSVLDRQEEQRDAAELAMSDARIRLAEARNQLAMSRADLAQDRLTLLQEASDTLAQVQHQISEIEATLQIVSARRDDLVITAPRAGILQSVAFANPGEVVDPGETLFELVPKRNQLILEARIPNADIGHVEEALPVSVTIDTYDVRRFGKVEGRMASVSPVSITDPQTGEVYFRATFALDAQHLGEGANRRGLQAGMTAVAEVTTGQQTLLSYFLKPVQTTLSQAFQER